VGEEVSGPKEGVLAGRLLSGGERERLPIPKKISFSRDLWSEKTGKASFAGIVKMAGGGRGGG
jgi:hypothetical protein